MTSLEDLERAATEDRIAGLDGFGEKSQQNILAHIDRAKAGQERMLLGRAFPIADDVESRLAESDSFHRVDIVGSFRRRRPTVGDLDILATAADPGYAMREFCGHEDVKEVLARGETKASVLVSGDLQLDLRIVSMDEYGAALVYFTGSKDHTISLRNRAINRGWKLNEYGLFDVCDEREPRSGHRVGDRFAVQSEESIHETIDLMWIPPELPENTSEVDVAATGELPDLVAPDDIRGDLHLHTEYSDRNHGIREMAAAADEKAIKYLLVNRSRPHAPISSNIDRRPLMHNGRRLRRSMPVLTMTLPSSTV